MRQRYRVTTFSFLNTMRLAKNRRRKRCISPLPEGHHKQLSLRLRISSERVIMSF